MERHDGPSAPPRQQCRAPREPQRIWHEPFHGKASRRHSLLLHQRNGRNHGGGRQDERTWRKIATSVRQHVWGKRILIRPLMGYFQPIGCAKAFARFHCGGMVAAETRLAASPSQPGALHLMGIAQGRVGEAENFSPAPWGFNPRRCWSMKPFTPSPPSRKLLLFLSHMWQGTIPFHVRHICTAIAFDLEPT